MSIETRLDGDAVAPRSAARTVVRRVALAVAVIGYVVAGFGVVVSGLVVPNWARTALAVVWFIGLERLIAWRRRPLFVIGVPIAMWAIIIGTAVLGEAFLGWTA